MAKETYFWSSMAKLAHDTTPDGQEEPVWPRVSCLDACAMEYYLVPDNPRIASSIAGQIKDNQYARVRNNIESCSALLASKSRRLLALLAMQHLGNARHRSLFRDALIRNYYSADWIWSESDSTDLSEPGNMESASQFIAQAVTSDEPPWWTQTGDAIRFFSKYPKVLATLKRSKEPLTTAFGSLPRVEIRIITEPEDGSDRALAVVIHSEDAQEGFRKLEVFKNDWWYHHVEEADYLLLFVPTKDGL